MTRELLADNRPVAVIRARPTLAVTAQGTGILARELWLMHAQLWLMYTLEVLGRELQPGKSGGLRLVHVELWLMLAGDLGTWRPEVDYLGTIEGYD